MPLTDDRRRARATQHQRELRELRKHLKALTQTVALCVANLDLLMQARDSPERGKAIAQVVNALDMANDRAMYFGLGLTFPAMARLKKAVVTNGVPPHQSRSSPSV